MADEQEKQVNAEATKIAKEAEQANAIAAECQEGLNKALPALESAEAALEVMRRGGNLRRYKRPN